MKRKLINGDSWDFLDVYSSKYMHIDDMFSGYISLIKVEKVKRRLTVDYDKSDVCLFDAGYKCIIFLPDNETWGITVVFDRYDEIIEWYFDMTKQNSINKQGIPFYDDLYLDIAVSPDFKIAILDEDELLEALEANVITKHDYGLAYSTCNRIIEEIIPNKEFLTSFFQKYLVCLDDLL